MTDDEISEILLPLMPLKDPYVFARAIAAAEREACAVTAWTAGMNAHNKARGMPCDAREVGSAGAEAIRARSNAELTGGRSNG